MVKGISKRVIVVREPDARLFEQAIFFVRDGAPQQGVSAERILAEAVRAANNSNPRLRWHLRSYASLWLLAGAAIASLVWGLLWLL